MHARTLILSGAWSHKLW